jgi:hypothetical protein
MRERTTVADRADDAAACPVSLAGVPKGFDELWSSRTHWDDYIAFCVGNLHISHVRFLLAVADYQWNPDAHVFDEVERQVRALLRSEFSAFREWLADQSS